MLAAFDLHTVAQYSALRIVESLAEGTVICGFAALLLRIIPRQSAGTRFAIWFSALVAIAIAPVATGVWSAQFPGGGTNVLRPAVSIPDSWAVYLFAAWTILASWFLLGVGRALWHVYALRRSCSTVDILALDPAIRQVIADAGGRGRVKLCTSEQVRVPTAIGLADPMIIVPRWVIDELTPAELKQVLIHEIAHLRRHDDWTNLVQHIVKAVFFFHPAVWWIEKEASLQREIACDDAVLAETESPRAYAECLAHLAERSFIQRSVALAQALLGRIRQTSTRVAQILDGNRPKGTLTWKPAVSLVAGFAIVFSVGASRFQRLIAFQDDSEPQVSLTSHAQTAGTAPGSSAFVHNTVLRTSPLVRPTQAKLVTGPAPPVTRKNVMRPAMKPRTGGMVHLASSKKKYVPVQETILFFVQSTEPNFGADDSSAIQMWRFTLLRYVVEPVSSNAPGKQI
jgi:beta-lactamase regulating signal transducer with metallopeptidase domain